MSLAVLSTVLSTIGLALAVYACVAVAVGQARAHNAHHDLRAKLAQVGLRAPDQRVASVETRLNDLATSCAEDRMTLSRLTDRVHRLAGRVQGLKNEHLNAEPAPGDREQLRAALLKGHHAVGTNHE